MITHRLTKEGPDHGSVGACRRLATGRRSVSRVEVGAADLQAESLIHNPKVQI